MQSILHNWSSARSDNSETLTRQFYNVRHTIVLRWFGAWLHELQVRSGKISECQMTRKCTFCTQGNEIHKKYQLTENMKQLLSLLLSIMIGMVLPRPRATGLCLRGLLPHTKSGTGVRLSDYECVVLSNVPRSGSTWFLSVLLDRNQTRGAVRATHYPFFDHRYSLVEQEENCLFILLVREPRDVWPSYQRIFGRRHTPYQTWETFKLGYEAHNEWWRSRRHNITLVEIQYEHFHGGHPLPFAGELELAYMRNAFRTW